MVEQVHKGGSLMRLVCIAGVVLSVALPSHGQGTIWRVPATFFDFHGDGSNPEFEILPYTDTPGVDTTICLVADTLDADGLMMVNPLAGTTADSGWHVDNIGKWFRDWEPGDTTTWIRPLLWFATDCHEDSSRADSLDLGGIWIVTYPYTVCDTDTIVAGTIVSDTAFKNVRVEDSLEFLVDDTITGGPATLLWKYSFFPIDGRGFGNDLLWSEMSGPTNYSFTAHIHNRITFHAGAVITISSDDDSWVFIDGRLAVDNGGLHSLKTKSLYLDSTDSFAAETEYSFDVFFAERKTGASCLVLDMTGVEFLDKQVVGVEPERQSARSAPQDGKIVRLAKHGRVVVPHATARISYQLVDARGRTLAEKASTIADEYVDLESTTGVAFVRIQCLDRDGRTLGVVTARLPGL